MSLAQSSFDPSDPELVSLFHEVSNQLIKYTPEHFQNIFCEISTDPNIGKDVLFYKIWCPEFPGQESTDPSPALHLAASRVVDFFHARMGFFPGFLFECHAAPDGTWDCNTTRMDTASGPK